MKRENSTNGLTEFFRHCPECGRRFHIRLESKKLAGMQRTSRPSKVATRIITSPYASPGAPSPVFADQEGKPVVVDVEEFNYSYKCKHCGHEWTEKHIERHRE